eukprot:scaffold85271_cov38-Phaeocystis_antarctica.AAC.2
MHAWWGNLGNLGNLLKVGMHVWWACMCRGEWHLEQVAKVRRGGESDVIRAQVRTLVGVRVRSLTLATVASARAQTSRFWPCFLAVLPGWGQWSGSGLEARLGLGLGSGLGSGLGLGLGLGLGSGLRLGLGSGSGLGSRLEAASYRRAGWPPKACRTRGRGRRTR